MHWESRRSIGGIALSRHQMPKPWGIGNVELRVLEDQGWSKGLFGVKGSGRGIIPSPAGGGCSGTGAGPR